MNSCLLLAKGNLKWYSAKFPFSFHNSFSFFILLLVGSLSLPVGITAQPQIALSVIANGFDSPVDIASAGDDRLFVVEQDGVIKIIDGNHDVLATPFLDIDGQVGSNGNEQGLLGLAFHPNYNENGYFFVYYTKNNGDTRVSRFTVDGSNPNLADPSSELVILEEDQPFSNHNGGAIKFGPDGYLYISLGDGGSGGDPYGYGQNRLTFLGKMLRIDIDNGDPYSIPETNPFAFDDFTLDEIWSLGLRNAWRFSFDRETGDMWIADVGQNEWEEVNFQPADSPGGENYGWRCFEGFETYNNDPDDCPDESQLTMPVVVYSNNFTNGCSITGGFVYRGTEFPELYGHYLYTDFCSGRIWSLTPDGDEGWNNVQLINSTNNEFTSFGEDHQGELYLAGRGSGNIFQIQEVCAAFEVSGEAENETCEGDANGSISLNLINGNAPYDINWSNGETEQSISGLTAGTYTVTVVDNNDCEKVQTFELSNGSLAVPPVIGVVENVLSVPDIYAGYQWLWNGNVIADANESSYEATQTGNYSVEVSSPEGCTAVSIAVEVVVNLLSDLQLNSFQVSPNPFREEITIEAEARVPGEYHLKVSDMSGKIVYNETMNITGFWVEKVSLKEVPAGTYLLVLEKNGHKIVKKLAKQ
ncbi:MAG: T9SS C-terminal target domain-containing protein [Bacteroidetes bacterium]|nr:MAG: T9SS C-terminal target domain-containing protein [Bacteroidota bacterium]